MSRKHGLATFVHERLQWSLYDQSPMTSETEWLCVDVDGYKIVNIYKPPPTRLQVSDLPVFPHPCLYAGDFNSPPLTGATIAATLMESASWPGQTPTTLPFSITQKTNQAFILDAGTLAQIRILLSPVLVLTVVYHTDVSWKRAPGHNIDPRLLHHLGFPCLCRESLLSDGTFARPIGATITP